MGYVVTTFEPSAAVVIIAARVKPALLRVEMVAGSRLGGEQISQEIRQALIRLVKVTP
jgi:hypothetical protein